MSIVFYAPKEINCGVCFSNYTPELLQSKPDYIFVFGDNLFRAGHGGQAIIRDEPNAIGVATKRLPIHASNAYMTGTEQEYDAINSDFARIENLLNDGKYIIFPSGGLGTGLSRLQIYAPELLNYIDSRVSRLIKTDYATVRKHIR